MVDCETETTPIQKMEPDAPDQIRWPSPPANYEAQFDLTAIRSLTGSASGKVIHVWAAELDRKPPELAMLSAYLAPDELERAARFRFPVHRNRFIAGRGLLRRLLAGYLNIGPQSLRFTYGPNGKPALERAEAALYFNLAHAEDLLLIALTRSDPIGIDVEQVRVLADAEDLVARFFSPAECAKFEELDSDQKPRAFFNLWTRKEAWLKATGQGITHLLNQVEVSFLSGEAARVLRLPESYKKNSLWSLYELTPKHDFVAALAASGDGHHVDCWRYSGF